MCISLYHTSSGNAFFFPYFVQPPAKTAAMVMCEYLLQEQSPFLTYISHCDTFLTLRASCTMSSKNFQFTTALDKEEMNLKEKLPGMSVEEQYDLLPPTECMYPSWFP
jgi:hypothetical protein